MTRNTPGGQKQPLLTFEELWPVFSSKPFPITLDQALVLIRRLHFERRLTEPVADDILYSIRVDDDLLARLDKTPARPTPPQHRLELWRAPDTTTLAAVSWDPGTLTHIHNHSHFGLTRTVKGSVTSLGFKEEGPERLIYLGRVHFEKNRVYHVPVGRTFIHAVANLEETRAVELHYYGPMLEGLKSQLYETEPDVDLLKLKDGDALEVKPHVDPEQIERRFN